MHFIEEVFGAQCDLYEVLGSCPRDADKAQLRKSYYRSALKYHPDRNPPSSTTSSSSSPTAHQKFQAISLAYEILQNPDLRAEYDETGTIPSDEIVNDHNNDDDEKKGVDEWKVYFDQIFGKVTASEIEAFGSRYKCSDEERRDVLQEFRARRGNLLKMLEFVMLSEARDAVRWVEDFLRPAMERGELDRTYETTMEKTLKQCLKKVEKENAQATRSSIDDDNDVDNDKDEGNEETESEEDSSPSPKKARKRSPRKATKKQQKTVPKKEKSTQNKRAQKSQTAPSDMSSLMNAIQNKKRGGGSSVFANLGARYGVDMDQNDPLDDAEFSKLQAKYKKQKK